MFVKNIFQMNPYSRLHSNQRNLSSPMKADNNVKQPENIFVLNEKDVDSIIGIAQEYTNPELIPLEKEAFTNAMAEKHAINDVTFPSVQNHRKNHILFYRLSIIPSTFRNNSKPLSMPLQLIPACSFTHWKTTGIPMGGRNPVCA